MNRQICDNKKLVIEIYNILRKLGIKTSNQGAKLIYLAIVIIINYNIKFIKLEDIYELISKQAKNMNKF